MAVVLSDGSSVVGSARRARLGRSLASPMVGDNSGPLLPLVLGKLGSEREGAATGTLHLHTVSLPSVGQSESQDQPGSEGRETDCRTAGMGAASSIPVGREGLPRSLAISWWGGRGREGSGPWRDLSSELPAVTSMQRARRWARRPRCLSP